MFLVIQRRRFAGGADRRQAVGALLDVPVHEPAQGREVDVAVAERRHQGHRHAGELFALGFLHGCILRMVSEAVRLKTFYRKPQEDNRPNE